MLYAASYALLDSVNLLLIGVIVAIGVALPKNGKYRRIVTQLVIADWLGVFLLALLVMFVFGSLQSYVDAFLESPAFGIILIVVGVVSAILTKFSDGNDNAALVGRLLRPLAKPGVSVWVVGLGLGLIQSATSAPFYAGIAVASVGDFSTTTKYVGMAAYATLALSLPALSALVVGWVRAYPNSPAGRGFDWARANQGATAKIAGYLVAVILTVMGAASLL